ncbi:MAG TPA: hypothetical protein PK263_02385 [bacterium]|nr:hypothetical protein [bacterium]
MTSKEALSALKKEIGSLNVLPPDSKIDRLPKKAFDSDHFIKVGRTAGKVIREELEYANSFDRRLSR